MTLPCLESSEHDAKDSSKTSDGLSHSIAGDEESDVASSTKTRVEKEMTIAQKEEKMIYYVRLLVFVAMLCSAVAVSIAVYFFAIASDKSLFETEVRESRLSVGRLVLCVMISDDIRLYSMWGMSMTFMCWSYGK
jgi:hypothetical protein